MPLPRWRQKLPSPAGHGDNLVDGNLQMMLNHPGREMQRLPPALHRVVELLAVQLETLDALTFVVLVTIYLDCDLLLGQHDIPVIRPDALVVGHCEAGIGKGLGEKTLVFAITADDATLHNPPRARGKALEILLIKGQPLVAILAVTEALQELDGFV
ncbi:hypothetical protein ACL1IE_12960 [Corynebacterium striatum]